MRDLIGDGDVPVYFEVFNGLRAIQAGEVWSIHYEQCNYFGLDALTAVFRRSGFEVLDAGGCYQEDQYLYVEARPGTSPMAADADGTRSALMRTVRGFEAAYRRCTGVWRHRLEQWRAEGKVVVVWGAGGKGVSFLSSLANANVVRFAVDVNPDRQGCFMPVGGQEVVSPARLREIRPDVVILANALYQEEITQQLVQLGLEAEILVA